MRSAYLPRDRRARSAAGFTLLEVLVALAIIAIALGALVAAAGTQTRNTAYLQDKTLAHWVAMNRAVELQLNQDPLGRGTDSGQEQMGARTWFWSHTLSTTEDPNVQRAEIEVRADRADASPLSRLTVYVYRAAGAAL